MNEHNRRGRSAQATRVMRELAQTARSSGEVTDPILEKLKQCPEAFKVGEILGKAFDSLKYRHEEVIDRDRILPPPGTIIPPFA
jgi:hypothetical protein